MVKETGFSIYSNLGVIVNDSYIFSCVVRLSEADIFNEMMVIEVLIGPLFEMIKW